MLTKEKCQSLFYMMWLIRRFEERVAELYGEGKIRGFLHLCIGQEAIATGVMDCLAQDDYIFATYREHGHALARGLVVEKIMAEMYGKQEGTSGGRGGSMHLFDRELKFFGGNAIVGGHLPLAIGAGLAMQLQKKKGLSVCIFGEGAVAEGEFHESVNLASLWKLPVLFICENNFYAMGTALEFSEAQMDFSKKAMGYNIPYKVADGMNVMEVRRATQMAVANIYQEKRPFLLEFRTFRFRAHSMFDPELYRSKSEVEDWKKRDPVKNFIKFIIKDNLMTEEELQYIREKAEKKIAESVAYAERGTWEPKENLLNHIYAKT